jgi:hypothetical protein
MTLEAINTTFAGATFIVIGATAIAAVGFREFRIPRSARVRMGQAAPTRIVSGWRASL